MAKSNTRKVVVGVLLTTLFYGCDVEQTQEGELPDVDVDVEGGQLPKYDVDTPDVSVGTKEVEVEVPDVEVKMEKKKVEVPTLDVEMPESSESSESK